MNNSLSTPKQIAGFVGTQLVDILRDDFVSGAILNERGLEYQIITNLDRNVDKKKFGRHGNVTISGITTKKKSATGSFLMPDIIITAKDQSNEIKLLFELKLDMHSSAFPEHNHDNIEADIRKCKKFVKNPIMGKQLEYVFFIYLYKCTKWSERQISNLISKKLAHKKLKVIAINRYQKKNGWYSELDQYEIDAKLKPLSRFIVGGNGS